MKNCLLLVFLSAALGAISLSALAQTSENPPAPSPTQTTKQNSESNKKILKQEESQRVFAVVPQFSVITGRYAPPLRPAEKFELFLKSTTDPFVFAAVGLQAGLGQATDEHEGYGQGAAGFGKRYGAALADNVSSNFFANFAYPVLFKEDPRFYRMGEGSLKHRLINAFSQEFVCRTDKGGRSFAFDNVLGAFTSGGISNLYYPPQDRGLGLTLSGSVISLAYGSAGGILSEFGPDIDRRLFHRHKKKAQPTPPQN